MNADLKPYLMQCLMLRPRSVVIEFGSGQEQEAGTVI
jgi:hypothetical protein